MSKYYGKYRAIVVDVNDPEKRGRIKVQCPKDWVMPSLLGVSPVYLMRMKKAATLYCRS